jgi:MinD-like ATPase involved in chromosome partitioning or flagellar assembly
MINPNMTLSLSIMSGKGGVGKTNLALNLGYALFRQGLTSLLMDCDLGLANLDVMLGLAPERNLQDLLGDEVPTDEVVAAIEPGGFDFLPAASGVPELVEMDEDMRAVLFQKITGLLSRYQMLVLDLGAGINSTALAFAAMTQLRLMVVTPEPTSLTDSYAMMKVLRNEHGGEHGLGQAGGGQNLRAVERRLPELPRHGAKAARLHPPRPQGAGLHPPPDPPAAPCPGQPGIQGYPAVGQGFPALSAG